MSSITGLSAKQQAQYLDEAKRLVSRYDTKGQGAIDHPEDPLFAGHTFNTYDNRLNNDYVMRTTIYYDRYTAIKGDEFRGADANHDSQLTSQEMLDAYLAERDSNHDGNLSFWEKLKMSFSGIGGKFERTSEVETDRQTQMVFDPLPPPPPYNPPHSQRPTPPSIDDRPTPPSTGSRPTPPSTTTRPTPPSIR